MLLKIPRMKRQTCSVNNDNRFIILNVHRECLFNEKEKKSYLISVEAVEASCRNLRWTVLLERASLESFIMWQRPLSLNRVREWERACSKEFVNLLITVTLNRARLSDLLELVTKFDRLSLKRALTATVRSEFACESYDLFEWYSSRAVLWPSDD